MQSLYFLSNFLNFLFTCYKKGLRDRRHSCMAFAYLRRHCSDILRTFSSAEPSKGPKQANKSLNAAWNTTLCKAASFFLFSLRLLPKKIIRILPITECVSRARELSRIRARARVYIRRDFSANFCCAWNMYRAFMK